MPINDTCITTAMTAPFIGTNRTKKKIQQITFGISLQTNQRNFQPLRNPSQFSAHPSKRGKMGDLTIRSIFESMELLDKSIGKDETTRVTRRSSTENKQKEENLLEKRTAEIDSLIT